LIFVGFFFVRRKLLKADVFNEVQKSHEFLIVR